MRPALLSRVMDVMPRTSNRSNAPKTPELAISERGREILGVLNDVFEGLAETSEGEAVACFRFAADGSVAAQD